MQKIIAANWKMYKDRSEAAQFAGELAEKLASKPAQGRLAIIFPPFTDIATASDGFAGISGLSIGGQNFYPEEQGAFTGEISLKMLRDAGASWALVGHSERRQIFGESDGLIARKTAFGLAHGFKIMLCIGETLAEREAGALEAVLDRQLESALNPLDAETRKGLPANLAIAYEPVWAIGTGKVAQSAEVLEAHAVVRTILGKVLGSDAKDVHILYGGSVKPGNAAELLALDNVDGLLVGGASLEAESFLKILEA